MNKTKRGLQLAAGIVGIVGSAILIAGGIYLGIALFALLGAVTTPDEAAAVYIIIATTGLIIAFSVALLVICAMLCRNPQKDGKIRNFTGLSIAALVLSLLLLICYIVEFDWFIIIPAVISGLLIAALCLKHPANQPAPKGETKE